MSELLLSVLKSFGCVVCLCGSLGERNACPCGGSQSKERYSQESESVQTRLSETPSEEKEKEKRKKEEARKKERDGEGDRRS